MTNSHSANIRREGFCLLWQPRGEKTWYYRTRFATIPATFGVRLSLPFAKDAPLIVFPKVDSLTNLVYRADCHAEHPWFRWAWHCQDGEAAVAWCDWLPWTRKLPRQDGRVLWQWRARDDSGAAGARHWPALKQHWLACEGIREPHNLPMYFRLARVIIPKAICFTTDDAPMP